MHVPAWWWNALRFQLDDGDLGLTCARTLILHVIFLDLNDDQTIARIILFITTSEVINAFVFNHAEGDGPIDFLTDFLKAQIDARLTIAGCIKGRHAS